MTSAEDIVNAKKNKKTGLWLASQCGDFIDYKLHRIEALYRLGLRMLILAYSATNKLCAGCLDRTDNGLTEFGRLVVEECNRIGLLLDCSHIGRLSSLEIIEHSRHPVVFSHSCTKALADNPRNIDDEQIKSCAAKGGIISMTKSIAREMARYHVCANVISLGIVATDMTEKIRTDEKLKEIYMNRILLKRFAEPEDISPAFVFLASDDSNYITGQLLCVDGGYGMI